MQKLTNFVIEMADNCHDVPLWLQEHKDFEPKRLLDLEVSSNQEDQF